MNCPRISVLLVLLACAICPAARAQIGGPAFDPNCYFPLTTDPSEMQVRYGDSSYRWLGLGLSNIGPAPGESYARLFFSGLPLSSVFMVAARTGASFDINNPDIQGVSKMPAAPYDELGGQYRLRNRGHFHTHDRFDLLYELIGGGYFRIYWADENGLYDSTRFTQLRARDPDSTLRPLISSEPYCAFLTEDTVEDIIVGGSTSFWDTTFSQQVYIFKGGVNLYNHQPLAPQDSTYTLWHGRRGTIAAPATDWNAFSGDYRGTGRKDLIAEPNTGGNFFYYRNDHPFSLKEFAVATMSDTLAAYWQSNNFRQPLAHIALPAISVKNDDFLLLYQGNDLSNNISVFKGGPQFGSDRTIIDSPNFTIRNPRTLGGPGGGHLVIPNALMDCGDMTGTARHVLLWQADDGSDNFFQFFYVLGEPIDDKIDMLTYGFKAAAFPDTLTANSDERQDVALGLASMDDSVKNINTNSGRIEIVYGSKKIPVPSNSVRNESSSIKTGVTANPNPFALETTITWSPNSASPVLIRLRDVLGRVAYEDNRIASSSPETFQLTIPDLPSGEYTIELIQLDHVNRIRVIVLR